MRSAKTISRLLFITTGCVVAWAVWFMNMNSMGYGSNPMFAMPIAALVVMLYIVLVRVLVEEMSDKEKLLRASLCFLLSCAFACFMTK